MLDQAGASPDLDLLLSPGDEAEFAGYRDWRRRDGRLEASHLWVVLHRRHGTWTHAYRVVRDRRPGCLCVYLERAVEGDARAAMRDWLEDRAGAARAGEARDGDARSVAARAG